LNGRYLKKYFFHIFEILYTVPTHFNSSIPKIKSMRSLIKILKVLLKMCNFQAGRSI
jgi:hypothetical protein